jgi:hypothetical protein
MQHSGAQFSATTIISSDAINGEFISGNPAFIKQFGYHVTHLKELSYSQYMLQNIYQSINQGLRFKKDVLMNIT